MKRVMLSVIAVAVVAGTAVILRAQDPVKVDPKHYTVITENDQVRVLRIHYAPGEKSVMHEHPDSVVVYLSDQTAKFSFPDGKSQEVSGKKGDATFIPAGPHLPENVGTVPIEAVLVEVKTKAAAK
jgi:quercetin dioxygenase-like cupin family protein